MCTHDQGRMGVLHLSELARVPYPLLAWTGSLRKQGKVCVQVAYFGRWFQGAGVGNSEKWNREGGKASPRVCHRAGHYCGQWVDVPGAGPCGRWERGLLVTMSIAFTHLTWFMIPRAWLLIHRQVHRRGQSIWGQERESHSWGGRCLQLVAAVMGAEKTGKEYVRQGSRRVHHFLLPEGLLCWCWNLTFVLLLKASSKYWSLQVETWWVLCKLSKPFRTFLC